MPTFEEHEDAYKFGYGARSHYRNQYPAWNDKVETQLQQDWSGTYSGRDWTIFREDIRRGWDYDENRGEMKKAA